MRKKWNETSTSVVESLRLNSGQVCRIAILDEDTDEYRRHWAGKQYQCLGTPCPFCDILGDEVKQRFAVYCLIYAQDNFGRLSAAPDGSIDGMLMPFDFGVDKSVQLKAIEAQYGDMRRYDLILTCTDEGFQKYTIMPAGPAEWVKHPTLVAKVQAEYVMLPRDLAGKMAKLLAFEQATAIVQKRGAPKGRQVMAPEFGQPAPMIPVNPGAVPLAAPAAAAPTVPAPVVPVAAPAVQPAQAPVAAPITPAQPALAVAPVQQPPATPGEAMADIDNILKQGQ